MKFLEICWRVFFSAAFLTLAAAVLGLISGDAVTPLSTFFAMVAGASFVVAVLAFIWQKQ
jgi:hypothetical protein